MLTGIVSPGHYVGAQHLHRRRVAAIVNWVLALVVVTGLAIFFVIAKKWGLILVGAGICGLIGEAIQSRWYLPRKSRHLYAQHKGIDTQITYTWDAEKIFVRSEMGSAERKWKDFVRMREDEQLFLLYTTDLLFEIVPKSWFSDAAQLDEFRRHAAQAGQA